MKQDIKIGKDLIERTKRFSSSLEEGADVEKLREEVFSDAYLLKSIEKYSDADLLVSDLKRVKEIDKRKEADMRKFMKTLEKTKDDQRKQTVNKQLYVIITGVAAAILFLSFLIFNKEKKHSDFVANSAPEIVVAPKFISSTPLNAPMLTLENGESVDLSVSASGKLGSEIFEVNTKSSDIRYKNIEEDKLIILDQTAQVEPYDPEPKLNTLTLPSECAYTLTLSDSTVVYLSANSKLTYPVSFSGERREVELEGMAYFNVKKGEKPFVVKTNGTEIKVYGTQFNVNAYNGDMIETTLVSGSVGVKYLQIEGSEEVVIKPNESIMVNRLAGTSAVTKDVDTSKYIAWLNGYFECNSQAVTDLLKLLASWYGAEFRYEFGAIEEILVSGSLSRETPIEELLEMIELTTDINFIKKGNIFYVM